MDGIVDAEERLRRLAAERFAVQLGGASGTLATYGGRGPDLVAELAARLGLAATDLPWHTNRTRIIEAAAAFAALAAAAGKIGSDIVLLSQAEVGELAVVPGSAGRSSAMPHKANPGRAVLAVAAAAQARAHAAALLTLPPHEHERAAGAWQAEWQPFSLTLRCTAAALQHAAVAVEAMTVRPEVMRRNLNAMRGLPMAESLAAALAPHLGAGPARECIERLCRLAVERETSLLAEALNEPAVTASMPRDAIGRTLDPAQCLGSTGTFIDRALAGAARRKAY
jgi:3-carboxy-cis,cis-muconate cycloisomerase